MNEQLIDSVQLIVLPLLLLWVGFSLRRIMQGQDKAFETLKAQVTTEASETRKAVGDIRKRLDEEAEKRHACQLAMALTYATKDEVVVIEKKVDATKEKVVRLEERTLAKETQKKTYC